MLIPLLAALAYLAAAALLVFRLRQDETQPLRLFWLVLPALALHATTHGIGWHRLHGPDLHFFAALSLVGLGMAAMSTIAAGTQRLEALRVLVYPLAAFFLLLYHFAGHGIANSLDWRLQTHALLALLAYAALAVAALLALMLWFQERALRQRQLHGWLRALPPLTQLESLLFRSLAASFVLLTLALVTGVLFVENLLAQHLVHKTVLSLLSWVVLATLLFGRWRYGWRGPRAVKLTLTAMALLALAFFGSKFVLEMILHRA
ncbi:MAG TPA: cytochrome c biogenesis protein CcsA [Arenimonas sp.]|uniref:cytochrome C assembly family protein n=1 Tax=Arenimonas sp. TaxID=1872635 RepID=UPI002B6E733E|nr:cytochrome c biogenesis protein CcsA [Arenimonas sp.]HMB57035.1 cytochrome c biogenesis protein CcsA [Arenimonas sp.]